MPFWSTQRIKLEHEKTPLIDTFKEKNIKQGAYELTLSREVIKTPGFEKESNTNVDGPFAIPSGAFALLYSQESVSIPNRVLAFISIKASKKLDGLINISGFHVDPGYKGRLKFSVYNAGPNPIFLDFHEPTFLIWFAEMDNDTEDPYNGVHQKQEKISAIDRQRMSFPTSSPATLDQRLRRLEHQRDAALWVCGIVLFPIVIAVVTVVATFLLELLKQ